MNIPANDVAARLALLAQSEASPEARAVLEQAHKQLLCLRQVHALLDGQEYDSDTASDIERCLTEVGFEIRDIDEMEDDEGEEE